MKQGQWDTTETVHQINRLKRKQYVAGNTYNGVALTVTGTNWTTTRAVFIPYQTIEGAWRMRFNLAGTTSAGATSLALTIAGVTFKNINNYYQACSLFVNASPYYGACRANYNTAIVIGYVTAASTSWWYSGDVELDSKPTWAD